MTAKSIQINIPIAWEYVRAVRQQVAVALADASEELRSAAVMVASELVENAIKYGTAVPAAPWAQFRFDGNSEYIQIQVSNGLLDATPLQLLDRIIKQLQDPAACEQLYMARLQQLVNDPIQPNRLGLYRIGYEGKFTLDYTYADQVLTLTARRHIP